MRKLPKVLTEQEIKLLLNTPNRRYRTGNTQYLLIRVALETGMRISELINLKRTDINTITGHFMIVQSKGNKDRVSVLQQETLKEIIRYWKMMGIVSEYCFSNLKGGKLIDTNLRRSIKKLGVKCGIERVHFHLLRHTALTKMYSFTKDIRLIQQIAGHSDISTTMIYTHISTVNIKGTLLSNKIL